MNGFTDKGLDESNFGGSPNSASSVVKSFDAFPKTKPTYTEQTATGGAWTIVLICASIYLAFSELTRWYVGQTTHSFTVEQGIGRDLQINLDMVVNMKCEDIHVNLQDASGDRILARLALTSDPTSFRQWDYAHMKPRRPTRKEMVLANNDKRRAAMEAARAYKEEDVHDYLGAQKKAKKFLPTPRNWRGFPMDSCRVYGTMHTNKVQGDFHITARGHGYMEMGTHLDHNAFNFSHRINELSFGPFYPSLVNPLDDTLSHAETHFYKYQYYLSVVPTVYTTDKHALRSLDKYHESPSSGSDGLNQHPARFSRNTIFTNQYAVTEQSHVIPENQVPGIFVKFDIEPILLTISEEWSSIPALFIRLVNVVSGVLVAGGWCYQLSEWAKDQRKGSRRQTGGDGLLPSGYEYGDEKRSM